MGSPMKLIVLKNTPSPKGAVGKSEMDLSTISSRGTMIGMKDLVAEGAFLTLSTASSSEASAVGAI